MKLTPIRVECYAGTKADETPRRFIWKGQSLEVGEVLDRWHQVEGKPEWPRADYFKVRAANDGVVVFAGFFGIFGNAVVIDHGCGLQTLYGHLSSLEVKEGDTVKNEQEIGKSGQTGLAGGDHLHFTMLVAGHPVNPVEWWDAHWIEDRVERKLRDAGR